MRTTLIAITSGLLMSSIYLHFFHDFKEETSVPSSTPKVSTYIPQKKSIPAKRPQVLGEFQTEKLFESFMDQSGLLARLSLPGKILNKHLNDPRILKKLSIGDLNKLKSLLRSKIGVDSISRKVKRYFLNSFTPSELEKLIAIYDNPTMKKVASMEEYLSSEETLAKAYLYQNQALKDGERTRLLKSLEKIKNEGERTFLITLQSIKGLHLGFNKVLAKDKRVPDKKVETTVSILKKFARPKFKGMALLRYDYAYRDLSAGELKEYLNYAKNPLMIKAQDATLRGILDSFKNI